MMLRAECLHKHAVCGCRKVAVVTSNFHMPRSRAIFETCFSLVGAALFDDPDRCRGARESMRKSSFLGHNLQAGFPSSRQCLDSQHGAACSDSSSAIHARSFTLVLPATLGTFPARSDRFQLTFHAASDEDIFPTEVLEARKRREAASLEGWQRMAGRFETLAALHAWLHSDHMCYAVARQVSPPGAFM